MTEPREPVPGRPEQPRPAQSGAAQSRTAQSHRTQAPTAQAPTAQARTAQARTAPAGTAPSRTAPTRVVSADPEADELKACCANAYSNDLVAMLLGDSYHPGGLALTRRLAGRLGLKADAAVLDVAAGRGATAMLLAQEHHARVSGVDLSPANVALAQGAADAAGLRDRVEFAAGDAEGLPYPDARFDAVVCECAFCTFPDKPTAAAEWARVLRPGGRVGITDVTAAPERLPSELTGLTAWIACVADARPLDEYATTLAAAGLRVTSAESHDGAMTRMIDQIEARLTVVRMTARAKAEALGLDFQRAGPVLAAARSAVADGALGYGLLIAEKPS